MVKKDFYLFLNIFFGVPHLAIFIFNFSFNVIAFIHPVCIQCRGLNLGHEQSAFSTRPWLLARRFLFVYYTVLPYDKYVELKCFDVNKL